METACPRLEQLQALLDETLPDDEQPALQAHLDRCAACLTALDRLAAGGATWDRAAANLGGPDATDAALHDVVSALQAAPPSSAEITAAVASGAPATPVSDETQAESSPPSARVELPFLEPSTQPGHLGRLEHYEVIDVLGRGGMGVVLRAFDEKLHRMVAIKVLGPHYAGNGAARQRFEREARAAAAVSHDHVVAIHAVGEVHGTPYLVMPLIVGKSLQERLDVGGPLDVKEVLRVGTQIARGLAAAHAQGLVHRDVKPANILLENGVERVKITDFGLARAVDDASITQSGVITGTPMFMSPEQARGEFAIDVRSDLFSLGSVLYALCTGRPPFRASSTHAVLKRVIEKTPRPIHEVNAEIPDWLEAIIAKLHAKKPEDRFASAAEVADLLGSHLAHLQEPRRAPKPAPVTPPTAPAPASAPTGTSCLALALAVVLLGGAVVAGVIVLGIALMGLVLFRADEAHAPPMFQEGPAPMAVNDDPARPPEAPWVPLFNGKDLAGWFVPKIDEAAWRVERGVLIGQANRPILLTTDRDDFADFHLRAECKINEDGIGGIWFRLSEPPLQGYKAQINADADDDPMRTGSLLKRSQKDGKPVNTWLHKVAPDMPEDVWFTYEIIARGEVITLKVNGTEVAKVRDATHHRGRIGLEMYGKDTAVHFKTIEIREVPPVEPVHPAGGIIRPDDAGPVLVEPKRAGGPRASGR